MKTLIKLVSGTEVARKSGYANLENANNAGSSWKRDCRIHKKELETRSFFVIDTELENEVLSVAVIKSFINDNGGLSAFSANVRRNRGNRPTRFNLIKELHILDDAELNIAFVNGLIGNNGRKGSLVENATKNGNICNI
jgi:hypothetical protein